MAGAISFTIESTAPENMSNTRIKVMGVGGAGGNAVDYMISSGLKNVEFITANTDAQALGNTKADVKLALGQTGRGAGSRPAQGREAAEQALDRIQEVLKDTDMLYISAGMGGGTGTGASPVIARMAREAGVLTVAVVTKPFNFEGEERMRVAEAGIEALSREVDALVVILNSKLEEELSDQDVSFEECFEEADKVLYNACSGIVQIIHNVGRINTDFEDVRSVMAEQGRAIIGVAEAEGPDRAVQALEAAINCPLMEDSHFRTVQNMLINVASAPRGLKQSEQRKMDQLIKEKLGDCHPFIKFGISTDETLGEKLRVTIIATGLDRDQHPLPSAQPVPGAELNMPAPTHYPNQAAGAPTAMPTAMPVTMPTGVPAGVPTHHVPTPTPADTYRPPNPSAYNAPRPQSTAPVGSVPPLYQTPSSPVPLQPSQPAQPTHAVQQPSVAAPQSPATSWDPPPQATAPQPTQVETVHRPRVLERDRWARETKPTPAVMRQDSKS